MALVLSACVTSLAHAEDAADDLVGFGPPESAPASTPPRRAAPSGSAEEQSEGDPDDRAGFGEPELPAAVAAGETGDADDQVGFGESSAPSAAPATATAQSESEVASRSSLTLTGVARVQSAIRLERGGPYRLAMLRQGLGARLQFKHDFARSPVSVELLASGRTESDFALLMNRDAYDAPTRELYTWQLLPWDSYLKLHASWFELTVGKQVVNFGQNEILSVIDIANPRDLREPLLGEVDDLRMPVVMTRASAAWGGWQLDALVVHESYFGFLPPPLGEFSPSRKLLLDNAVLGPSSANREVRWNHIPGHSVSNAQATQAHGRLAWSGPGVDLSLHAGSVLDVQGVSGLPQGDALEGDRLKLPFYHPRYTAVGATLAVPVGPVVLRTELGADVNRMLAWRQTDSRFLDIHGARQTVLQGTLGLTYLPSASTSAVVEVLQRYLTEGGTTPSGNARVLMPYDATQLAFRLYHQFLRERAHLMLVALVVGVSPLNAWAGRAELGYSLRDALELTLGAVTYHPTESMGIFYGFNHHDRAFLNLRWTFDAT